MELFTILVALLIVALLFVWHRLQYWKRKGVPFIKPIFMSGDTRGLGSSLTISEVTKHAYDRLKGKGPLGGLFLFLTPTAIITDLDLVKNVLIKDFSYFPNRKTYFNEKVSSFGLWLVTV